MLLNGKGAEAVIAVEAFRDRQVAVFGLGASGLASAKALVAGGAEPLCWDDSLAGREAAENEGLTVVDLTRCNWGDIAALCVAPGVPLTHPAPHPMVDLARMTDTPVLGDIELFARAVANAPDHARPRIVAITGTNGKSTTTALIGHILAACGRDAQVGGNIGRPALALDPIHAGAIYVLELSSYQLDLTTSLAPDVSVFLNLAPDHLDRHGDMDGYLAAKTRIFQRQGGDHVAVLGVDDAHTQRLANAMMAAQSGPRVIPISAGRALGRGAHAVGGVLYDSIDGRAVEEVADLRVAAALTGRHNWQNAAAAYAATRALGVSSRRIGQALQFFPGLPHRLENVAVAGTVRFINDSKATNPAAARQALASYETIYWIAGGRAKDGGVSELLSLMPRVAKAYLIGEAAEAMAAALKGRVVVQICRTMEAAVEAAGRDALDAASPHPVVLLSPACASFDQYANFEKRGDHFRSLARSFSSAHPLPATG